MYPSLAATLSPPTLWCRTAIPKNLHSRPNISSPGEKLGLPEITQLREQPAEPSKLVSLRVPPRVLSPFLRLYLPIHIYICLSFSYVHVGKANPGVLLHIYPSLSRPYPLTLAKWSVLFEEHPSNVRPLPPQPPFTPLLSSTIGAIVATFTSTLRDRRRLRLISGLSAN